MCSGPVTLVMKRENVFGHQGWVQKLIRTNQNAEIVSFDIEDRAETI